MKNVPKHVAIIPDGNRRWAVAKGLKPWQGHEIAGKYENIKSLVTKAKDLGVEYLSMWAFSTENWKRTDKEIKVLWNVIKRLVVSCRKDIEETKTRFFHIGRKDRMPRDLADEITKLEKDSKKYTDFNLILCLDYGGRDEIVRAVNKILKERKKEINVEEFKNYLDTTGIPDPDLIIRTGGEIRMSGFMPFQSDYAEFYFTETYFPDFTARGLEKAINEYARRQRRFGG